MVTGSPVSHAEMMEVIYLGMHCRLKQKEYFHDRSTTNLVAAKTAEREFDKAAEELMLKLGFKPTSPRPTGQAQDAS